MAVRAGMLGSKKCLKFSLLLLPLLILESAHARVRAGTCPMGKEYKIQSVGDLGTYKNELDCIFMGGIVPTSIPMGTYKMRMLQILNTRTLNPLLNLIATGKYASTFNCTANTTASMLWNNVLGNPIMPGILRIGKLTEYQLDGATYQDDKGSVLIDYGQDVASKCDNYNFINFLSHGRRSSPDFVTTKQITKNYFPLNQNIGGLRFVGRSVDGTGIYLGKMFMKDLSTERYGFLAYFSTLNNDKSVCPSFKYGDTLPPLDSAYSYKYNGLLTTIGKGIPRSSRHAGLLAGEFRTNFKVWQRLSEVRRNPGYKGRGAREEFIKTFNTDYLVK